MQELTVASYNVHKCVGLDLRRDPMRTVQVISELGADIVALQEADRRFGDRAGLLDLEHLRELSGLQPVLMDSPGRAHGWHGNLVLIRDAEVEDLRQITLPGLEPRGALMIDLKWNGMPLRIIATHLGLLRQSRLLQARALDDALRSADDRPVILLGDLNEWRVTKRSSLTPLAFAGGKPAKLVPSFPARFPVLPLDRILTCPAAEMLDIEPHSSPLARIASDHLPIRARLRFAPSEPKALRA